MQNKIISKALSLTAAAVLGCTGILGSGTWITASANIEVGDYSNDAMQKVVVKVAGDAVLATAEGEALGTDFLDTPEAEKVESQIESVQARVQRSIREFYPELTVKFSYSTLFNGFYCELPESLVKYVREVPLVESVTIMPENVQLHMATAPGFSEYPAYYNTTGCTGEGQVVCVIDSELDMSHPMFAPLADDVETKLSKEDIAEIIASGELNANCDVDVAYRSNKLPFVFDYVDDDQVDGLPFEEMYHGTHVSGIAAGNEIEDDNGNTISGIAKDAQLIFMSIGALTVGGMDLGAAIAATEDAVKLHADVINMSWGTEYEYYGVDPFAESITAAQNAGVMVCIAAGNADNGSSSYWRTLEPENPDIGTMSDKAELGSSALLVASADNIHTESVSSFKVGDRLIRCYSLSNPFTGFEINPFDFLERGDLPYTYCGQGKDSDFEGLDLTGQIALVDRGIEDDCSYEELSARAEAAGAIGIVYIDFEASDTSTVEFDADTMIPCGLISYEDGQFMIEQENKIISNSEDDRIKVDYPTDVSFYTSWGVKQSLDLRPDIMGIGGYVESAGYNGSEETMSGTSMATPYMCGCVAELSQYMAEQGIELTGKERTDYIHNLLMNTAVPYTGDFDGTELYITPRRQGAGLVNLNNVLKNKILMTGAEGVAKVNLYDNLADTFSFDINLANFSNEDVDFTNARLELTTDSVVYDEDYKANLISGQQALISSADLSGLLHVSAGDSLNTSVTVSLDAAQVAAISETFYNGFFVEGYLILEGAENNCDISIPLLGFHGDWAQIPIIKDNYIEMGYSYAGTYSVQAGYSLSHAVQNALKISELSASGEVDKEAIDALYEQFLYEIGGNYISPNGDNLADQIALTAQFMRQCQYKITITDSEGNVVAEKLDGLLQDKDVYYLAETDELLTDLPDGDYTMTVTANIDYPSSYENPQVYTGTFTIDTKAPKFKSKISERDGRTILTLTGSDDQYLDSIMVIGRGNAGVVGEFDPDTYNFGRSLESMTTNVLQALSALGAYGTFKNRFINDAECTPIARLLNDSMSEGERLGYDFFDIVPVQKGAGKSFKVEYDITDLSDYYISAVDAAYNMTTIETEKYAANFLKSGSWMSRKGIYDFTATSVIYTDIMTGDSQKCRYTLDDGVLTLTHNGTSETILVSPVDDTHVRFTYEDGEVVLVSYEGFLLNNIHTVPELQEAILEFTKREYPDMQIDEIKVNVVSLDNIQFFMTISNVVITLDLPFYCSALSDYATTPFSYDQVNLFEQEAQKVMPGTYTVSNYDGYYYITFNKDCKTGYYISTSNYDETKFSYAFNEETSKIDFVISGEEGDKTYSAKVTADESGNAYIYEEDPDFGTTIQALYYTQDKPYASDSFYRVDELSRLAADYMTAATGKEQEVVYIGPYYGMFAIEFSNGAPTVFVDHFTGYGYDAWNLEVDLNNPPCLSEEAYSLDMMKEWALSDYVQKQGDFSAAYAEARAVGYNSVAIALYDDFGNTLTVYTVDATTGIGTDGYSGEAVNLPQTGNNAPAGAATAAAAVVMMLLGLGTAAGSGVLRRKKDCE